MEELLEEYSHVHRKISIFEMEHFLELDSDLEFGKYKGKSFLYTVNKDHAYAFWMYNNNVFGYHSVFFLSQPIKSLNQIMFFYLRYFIQMKKLEHKIDNYGTN